MTRTAPPPNDFDPAVVAHDPTAKAIAELVALFLSADLQSRAGRAPSGCGCRAFYTPEQWRERGEEHGGDALLILCHDGGDLAPLCNYDHCEYEAIERFAEALAARGLRVECQTTWYSAVYCNPELSDTERDLLTQIAQGSRAGWEAVRTERRLVGVTDGLVMRGLVLPHTAPDFEGWYRATDAGAEALAVAQAPQGPEVDAGQVGVGQYVRAFDFGYSRAGTGERGGRDLDGDRANYAIGTIRAIVPAGSAHEVTGATFPDCDRYAIAVAAWMRWGTLEHDMSESPWIYPPVNGTPRPSGPPCDGVQPLTTHLDSARAAELSAQLDVFAAECQDDAYMDTGDAWVLLDRIRAALWGVTR